MEIQYWATVTWQENANASIANEKPTLGQYIHVIWESRDVHQPNKSCSQYASCYIQLDPG